MKYTHKILIVAAVAALAASCSGTRNLKQPELDMPAIISAGAHDTVTIADIAWWEFYTDSNLVYIIRETLEHNRNLMAAAARVEQLNQLYGVSKSNFFPKVEVFALGNRETNDYYGENFINDPQLDLKASLSWEADLWGGLNNARKQALANYRGSVEDERAMRITLIAEAARAYVNLVALDNELAIVRRTLYTREENLNKAKLRFEGGLTPETVYQQAQVEYATTAAMVPALERNIDVQKNAIALLMGRFPSERIVRGTIALEEPLPERFPVGLPSTLLQRRPDIRSAEAALKSALAGVGVAYADRFPRLRLNLTGGWENDELTGFFKSPFSYVLGSITGTVLDFGRNKRKYKAAVAAYDQARYKYEQTVLTAFHEVDNALLTYRRIRETTQRRRELREAAQKYAQLAYVQYNMGVINYIDVLDAQRRYFDAQIGLANAVRDEYFAMINLYKTLGGGWHVSR
ncbi:MAG: efflux transporter outer membrane subunit [Bacteroidales bacterium]|nr:efflux transporter outer membrane subunit [Bacteroidales bacterium]